MFSSKGKLHLLIILSSLLIYNCSESTEPDDSINELIPLKIGNTWNYLRTVYDSTGIVSYTEDITSTVVKDTTIDGNTWYSYNNIPTGIWYTNKSDGYWVFVKADYGYSLNDSSWIVYKFPCLEGEKYGEPNFPIEVISTDEMISVPAGQFKTIHLITYWDFTNYLMHSFETFITPDLGIVKRMQIGKLYDGTKFIVYKDELVSYSIE